MKEILVVSVVYVVVSGAVELTGPVDLSWPYDDTARPCPGGVDFKFTNRIVNLQPVWHSLNTFTVSEHCGTHIDAPSHFDPEGISVEKIPLKRLLVTGVYIDASRETGDDVNYTMPLSKIQDWEKANGPLPDNSVVMVHLGWAARYSDKARFWGKTEQGHNRFPGLSLQATRYLIDSHKVVGVGVDSPSVDPGYDTRYPSHVALTKAGLYILENVALTAPLPPLFKLIVAPMKIAQGTGGPTRLIALPLHSTL